MTNKISIQVFIIMSCLILFQTTYIDHIVSESNVVVVRDTVTITVTDTITKEINHFNPSHEYGLDTCHYVSIGERDDKVTISICRTEQEEIQALKNRGYKNSNAKKQFMFDNGLRTEYDYYSALGYTSY